jgi:class 3 adenylate cyclase
MKKSTMWLMFLVFITAFLSCALLCAFNRDVFKKSLFQKTTVLNSPAMAKFERDGNLYIIDSGSFRLICMEPNGKIRYTINIDKFKEYTRVVDAAIDGAGNLYIYAVEAQYNANLTKRDIIRKYDNNGRFIKDILNINYSDIRNNPRLFYQFGSFRYDDGMLTFSRIERNRVTLYQYDTFRDILRHSAFTDGVKDFSVVQLVLKDMQNFAFVQRDGDIYEVINGGIPELQASFNWTEKDGGIIPWHIFYDAAGNLVFFDMGSNDLFRIISSGRLQRIIPERHFETLKAQGERPALKGFGFFGNTYAGVYGDVVWMYDGVNFVTFDGELQLPFKESLRIIIIQIMPVFGILALVIGICILFIGIFDGYISLFVKQTVVIIPLTIIAFIIVFSTTYNIKTDRLNDALFNEIMALAMLSAKIIDGDDIDNITSIKDFNSDSYKRLSVRIKEIVGYNADPWNQKYYAALFKGSNFEYSIFYSNDGSNLFRPAELLEGEYYDYFMSGRPIGGIFSLIDGDWAFALAPVYNSAGKISGLLEIGVDMIAYEISNVKLRRDVALIVTIVCLVILLALGFLVSVIVRHLSSVARVLHAISGGNRNERVRYKARDELGKVSVGLNKMAEELQTQFDRITHLNESTIRFVPIQFMEQLGVSDITKMKLGDNIQRDISVLFFDIRYFSINSEMMTARENFIFINEVLGIAGPIIRKNNGFVDKYIGDAAMALFVNGMDAVRAGVELYQTLVVDKNTKVKIGVDSIIIGVGIHTGSVMMGIVGENERLSSTVISANVNLASRVEGLSKQTGSGVLITRDTLNQLAGNESEFAYRFIGMIKAAGVNEVIGLFDMLDALSPRDKKFRLATKTVFESGVRKYHMKDYATAVKRFEKVVEADPLDICAIHHLEEARRHLEDSTLPSVFVFDKK